MSASAPFRRWPQILAWAITSLFVLGFFLPPLGMWTGAILGVWFVGTQKPLRGFLWQMAVAFVPSLIGNWSRFPLTGPLHAFEYLGSMFLLAFLVVLPFLFHRLVSPYLPGFLSTLPFPLFAGALHTLAHTYVPAGILSLSATDSSFNAHSPLLFLSAVFGPGIAMFFVDWFAATVIWMWNHEFRIAKITMGTGIFALTYGISMVCSIYLNFSRSFLTGPPPAGTTFAKTCLAGAMALAIYAVVKSRMNRETWDNRPQTLAILRSPSSRQPVQWVRERSRESLVTPSGERFPIHDGIPIFLTPDDLTGANGKYNHLYETIGGFYDDSQRVIATLIGLDRDTYVMSYLGRLEVESGDRVLETSVGTGLNFKYLPRNIKRFGLDLSAEMLANCHTNLLRWEMDADLFLGNAENLPFADSSFDVVFHAGGINFFSDRAKAIREMIRVAKPGSLILIADETEEYVKAAYEHIPITSSYYKSRPAAVSAPIGLVPSNMQDIHLEIVWNNRFYALTFRKPLTAPALPSDPTQAALTAAFASL